MDTQKSALLVMDVQPNILDRVADKQNYLAKVKTAVEAAHNHNIQVIYVVVGFRPGMPEISQHNLSFSNIKQQSNPGLIDPRPAIEPTGTDIIVTKRRVSAFTGSDLAVVLSGLDITRLILCGIATSGVVLSTVREAADKDYSLSVLADLCADMDEEVHSLLTSKVFPRQAKVISSQQWLDELKTQAGK